MGELTVGTTNAKLHVDMILGILELSYWKLMTIAMGSPPMRSLGTLGIGLAASGECDQPDVNISLVLLPMVLGLQPYASILLIPPPMVGIPPGRGDDPRQYKVYH